MNHRISWYYETILRDLLIYKIVAQNCHQLPTVSKINLNTTCKEISKDKKNLSKILILMELLSGQKPVMVKAKKSISQWKLRKGYPIGAKVTLRNQMMFSFLDRLIHTALCKDREFRGITLTKVKGKQGYSFSIGFSDSFLFPEIESQYEKFQSSYGFNLNCQTTSHEVEELKLLVSALHLPLLS
uniref:Ribosomal protein L5 n=1 Tax=Jakoba libera TaxID=143017 RepID=M4QA19_JAKLI|nr:ribosomal protein L5 [Jakoba libera]AGH24206.1 ribosomal protein L5 [Jakoba libera]